MFNWLFGNKPDDYQLGVETAKSFLATNPTQDEIENYFLEAVDADALDNTRYFRGVTSILIAKVMCNDHGQN